MRRKKKSNEDENHERWLVSYADLVTLLFAFFVVMFATSEQNTEKGKKFEESVKKYLVKVGIGMPGKKTINKEDINTSPIEAPLKKHNKTNPKAAQLMSRVENYLEKSFNEKDIEDIIQDISGEDVGLRITFKASSLFQKNSNRISSSGISSLIKLGDLFRKIQYRVYIESHTEKIRNSWELAAGRGTSLVEYFIGEHKISPSRIAAISYGSSRPVKHSEEKYSSISNDRVDFLIITEDLGF